MGNNEVRRTAAQVPIRTTRLDLCNILLLKTQVLINPQNILSDGARRHAIGVVRDTTKSLSIAI